MTNEETCFNCGDEAHAYDPRNKEGELICPDCEAAGWTSLHIVSPPLKDIPTKENDNDNS